MSLADYARIERAILYLDDHFLQQPRLSDVARAAGLSEFHCQRLFRRWAGISPKRFLQFLTAGYARQLLNGSSSTLDAACDAGLSSVSRLHDLVVHVYAATPGELKLHGEGLTVRYGQHPSPFGDCTIGVTGRGICWLSFDDPESSLHRLRSQWSRAELVQDPSATRPLVQRIFAHGGDVTLHLSGTNFQVKVWEALLRVPFGAVTSYEHVATQVCSPAATRAVANAVAANRVAFLIPCHRIIRKTGAFGGYRWGITRKRAMLVWEAAQAHNAWRGSRTSPDPGLTPVKTASCLSVKL